LAVLGTDGQWHVATATVRDEATYRVAADVAMGATNPGAETGLNSEPSPEEKPCRPE
jgi:hypothetical protein